MLGLPIAMQISTLCYIKKKSRTLMLHRVKKQDDVHEGKWNGLGGKFLPGETPEECVCREVREESGLTVDNPVLRGVMMFPEFKNKEDWLVFLFTAEEFSGEMISSPEGHLEWVPDDQLLQLNLWEGDKIFLKWLEEGRFFSAKFIYKDKRLLKHSVVFYDSNSGIQAV